ncbi:MAG: MerR family transcriptional regulator, partial [Candidatus Acidiferrales bacterium]
MVEHYTRSEVARILGIGERRLNYWERLRLIEPNRRWGQRFYSFRDLVALKTI